MTIKRAYSIIAVIGDLCKCHWLVVIRIRDALAVVCGGFVEEPGLARCRRCCSYMTSLRPRRLLHSLIGRVSNLRFKAILVPHEEIAYPSCLIVSVF